MKKRLAAAVAVLALFAACGGGSSGGGGGTTPSATSTKSIAATSMVIMGAFESFVTDIMPLLTPAGAMVTGEKVTGVSFTCDQSLYTNFLCTGTDLQGGWCSVSGSQGSNINNFTFSYDCTNFHPDADTVLNGSFAVELQLYSTSDSTAVKGVAPGKAVWAKEDGAGECAIADNDVTFDDGACTEGGTCNSNLAAVIEFSIGSGGLVLTDSCGTFTYGSDFKVSENLCINPTDMVMELTMSGTLNGGNADYSSAWTCSYVM
jgi:hypothetical protein